MSRKPTLVLSVLATIALRAAAQPYGAPQPEFRVNTYTFNYQGAPDVAADAQGGFVVVWHGVSPFDSAYWRVTGQRYSSSFSPLGAEFHVGSYTSHQQQHPSVTSGGSLYVVSWQEAGGDSADDVYVQRMNTTGTLLGPAVRVNEYTSDQQGRPSVAADQNGNFAVAWQTFGQDSQNYGIWGRRFASTGAALAPEFQVAAFTTFTQDSPSVARTAGGRFVVAFRDKANDYIISADKYAATGENAIGQFRVSETYNPTSQPSVAMTPYGDYAVAWTASDGAGTGVFVVVYSQYNYKYKPEFRVNTYTTGHQSRPDVAFDADGNFVVVWTSYGQDGSGYGVFGQRFNATLDPLGPEFRLSTTTTGDQVNPRVAATLVGDFVMVWSGDGDGSGRGVWARRLCKNVAGDADGNGVINVTDVLWLINTLFAGGPPPIGYCDTNSDGQTTITDVLFLINYLFAGGPEPACVTALG